MPEPDTLLQYILREIACEKDWKGKKLLVTAGPTQESMDPVRYLTNHSTGKMGFAIACRGMLRGADVTLVTGPTALEAPMFVKTVPVVTAEEMFDAVTAVADYRPAVYAPEKQKKQPGDASIPLTRTKDILQYLGMQKRPGQLLCGFSMETEHMLENSRKKLERKNLDMICANNLKVKGAGFGTDTNVLTLLTKDQEQELPLLSKEAAGDLILDQLLQLWKAQLA